MLQVVLLAIVLAIIFRISFTRRLRKQYNPIKACDNVLTVLKTTTWPKGYGPNSKHWKRYFGGYGLNLKRSWDELDDGKFRDAHGVVYDKTELQNECLRNMIVNGSNLFHKLARHMDCFGVDWADNYGPESDIWMRHFGDYSYTRKRQCASTKEDYFGCTYSPGTLKDRHFNHMVVSVQAIHRYLDTQFANGRKQSSKSVTATQSSTKCKSNF